MNFMLVLRSGEICLYVYPLYIFPSIFFYYKDLQDSTGYSFPQVQKDSLEAMYQFILMLEAFKEIWLMKNDTSWPIFV